MKLSSTIATAVLLAACAGAPAPSSSVPRGPERGAAATGETARERGATVREAAAADRSAATVSRESTGWRADAADDLGPGILVPSQPGEDAVVAVVGDVQIRKSHVYDRMQENDRRTASVWVDLLVMDSVVAEQARRFGIVVRPEEIEPLVSEEEDMLRARVDVELGERMTFDQYVQGQFGLTAEEYRSFLTLDLARVRYRSYVIRYLAMREDQVEVRFIVHRDPAVLEDLRQKVLAGADFATLARRWSEDETRRDGGRLAPFGRAFRHPIAQSAFELEPGQVSELVPFEGSEGARQAIVYCLRRMPARDLPFAEVRAELAAELERQPVTPFEQRAFTLQYCQATESLPGAEVPR